MTSGRHRANALIGVVAGIVLVVFTIWTAAGSEMDGTSWAGAVVALLVGVACTTIGLVRLRRPHA